MRIKKVSMNNNIIENKKEDVAFGFDPVVISEDIYKAIQAESTSTTQKMLIYLNRIMRNVSNAIAVLIEKAKYIAMKMDSKSSPLVKSHIDPSVWGDGCKVDKIPYSDLL